MQFLKKTDIIAATATAAPIYERNIIYYVYKDGRMIRYVYIIIIIIVLLWAVSFVHIYTVYGVYSSSMGEDA